MQPLLPMGLGYAEVVTHDYIGTPEKGIRRLDPKTAHERRVVGPDSWLYSGQ